MKEKKATFQFCYFLFSTRGTSLRIAGANAMFLFCVSRRILPLLYKAAIKSNDFSRRGYIWKCKSCRKQRWIYSSFFLNFFCLYSAPRNEKESRRDMRKAAGKDEERGQRHISYTFLSEHTFPSAISDWIYRACIIDRRRKNSEAKKALVDEGGGS